MTAGTWDAADSGHVTRLTEQLLQPVAQDAALVRDRAETLRTAIGRLADDDPDRGMYLTELGMWLDRLFELTDDDTILAQTMAVVREALSVTSQNHPERWFPLSQLGLVLRQQFEQTADIETLRESVLRLREALAAAPASGQDAAAAHSLAGLSASLLELYRVTGEEALLAEAVEAGRMLAETPPRHLDHATGPINLGLINLGLALTELFGATGDPGVAEEGVSVLRQVLTAWPSGHPFHTDIQGQLGWLLTLQATHAKISWSSRRLRAEAAKASRLAVVGTPPESHVYGNRLLLYALSLEQLYRLTPRPDLLDGQISVLHRAIAAIPVAQPSRGTALFYLAEALRRKRLTFWRLPGALPRRRPPLTRPGRMVAARLHAEEISYYERAADLATAYPASRLLACLSLIEPKAKVGPERVLAAAQTIADLMPLLVGRELVRSDRERQLSILAFLPGLIAAAAVSAHRPDRAVELLEQARGLLVADLVDARSSDLTRLREAAPALADEFTALWSRLGALDTAGTSAGYEFTGGLWAIPAADPVAARKADLRLADQRRGIYQAWYELLARIRATDDFADFFRAPDFERISAQARSGPVVLPYTSSGRCGALIVTGDNTSPVREIHLPKLSDKQAWSQYSRLTTALRAITNHDEARISAEREISAVLAWLWDAVAGPVLDTLGYIKAQVPDDIGACEPSGAKERPRIWWCPVGVFALLPLHAAGHHADVNGSGNPGAKAPRTVLDRVVSSYTPTVRSLAYARAHSTSTARPAGSALVVAVPDSPGAAPLPGVLAETRAVLRLLPDTTVLPRPTRDSVRAALPSHAIVHFGCHVRSEPGAPSASHFVLYDDGATPLTIADVSALHLNASLAFLSACETTTTSPELADESVHITGAFALAGYQHVVGTLWPISDVAARRVAGDFYEILTKNGVLDTASAAHALHDATKRLRRRFPDHPSVWAAHTHTGP